LAEQRDAGVVDEDVESGMRGTGRLRERFDLRGLGDIDPVHADFARLCLGDLGGEGVQPGLVAIGQRQVATAACKLKRQRAADATGRAGHGGGGSMDSSHSSAPFRGRISRADNPYTADGLWPTRFARSLDAIWPADAAFTPVPMVVCAVG